jgi:hypothetical protein
VEDMEEVMEEDEPKIEPFSGEAMGNSSNPKVKEILSKLEDESIVNRIRSYAESHDKYEKSAGMW